MQTFPHHHSTHRKQALLIAAVAFLSFTYFYGGGGWNQDSRFDLLRAILERHTLQIDAYHQNTGDKAHFEGHYYSDKAPGLVFLALPFAVAARVGMRMAGVDPESPRGEVALSYIVTAGAVALPTALACVCLFFLGVWLGASPSGAAFGALAMSLGTPIYAYATLFWAHAVVGALLLFAFAAALKLRDCAMPSAEFLYALAVGLAAGWATVSEYPAAPAAVVLACFALSQAWPRGRAARLRTAAGVGAGALPCLIVLMLYLHAAFGSIFRPSYAYYDPHSFTFMHRGYLGLTYPHVDVLLKILFSCRRGLFFAAPVAAAAPVGLAFLWKNKPTRAAAVAASAVAAYYFLFNASFYEWRAGLSYGPRYAGAAIPLLCLGLPAAFTRSTPAWRRVLVAFAVCSIFSSLMVISTASQLSEEDNCPIFHSVWPAFRSGQMSTNKGSMLTVAEAGTTGNYGAFNLGQLLGLRGLASLIPLLAIWGIAAFLWIRMRPREIAVSRTAQLSS
jgi:hypothetical protein